MNTVNHYANESISDLIAKLDAFAEPGIDPAFDLEMEELERQFAEIRLTFSHY